MVMYLMASLGFAGVLFAAGAAWVDAQIYRILARYGDGFIPAYFFIMGSLLVYIVACAFFFDWMARIAGVHHG